MEVVLHRRIKLLPLFLLVLSFSAIVLSAPIGKIMRFPSEIYVDFQEVDKANKENQLGSMVKMELAEKQQQASVAWNREGEIVFKLFGVLPIRKISAKILPEEEVFVGGCPIGLNVKTKGVMVISDCVVDSTNASVIKNKHLRTGDRITRINGVEVKSTQQLVEEIANSKENEVTLELMRKGEKKNLAVPLIKNGSKRQLGIWVRDDVSGVGTLTFVDQNSRFGALGHGITDGDGKNSINIEGGNIYSCNVVNVVRGERNKPGELQAVFVERDRVGQIDKNTNVGVFGKIDVLDGMVDTNRKVSIGGRLSVHLGEASIISSISGINEEYQIEIIKTNNQQTQGDKSFVFRVKDKRLLELTGGIVQGMSGSPILQDGKIIGAVTHVFITDPTKGYGVYSDWMLVNIQ